MADGFAWWHPGYRWFCLRVWWRGLPDRVTWWLAWKLPRKVALYAFVRVYGAWGECGPDYDHVYRAWESASSKARRRGEPE